MKTNSNRRRFIKAMGLGAGGSLLTPMLSPLVREALGQADDHKVIVTYLQHLGIGGERPMLGTSEVDFTLNGFEAMEPFKSECLVLDRFYSPWHRSLHGPFWHLTAREPLENKASNAGKIDDWLPMGPSFDRMIGQLRGDAYPFKALALNACMDSFKDDVYVADGPKQFVRFEWNVVAAYDKVFGVPASADTGNELAVTRRLAQDRSVLDFVVDDVKRAEGRLASSEKAKLEQYLGSLRSLETQLSSVVKARASCSNVSSAMLPPKLFEGVKVHRRQQGPYQELAQEAMLQFSLAALRCRMTSVATIFAPDIRLPYLETGSSGEVGGHGMHHAGSAEARSLYFKHHARHMATLWKGLKDAGLGDKSLLFWANTAGGRHHNGAFDIFFMLFGSLGGKIKTGRYLMLPTNRIEKDDPRLANTEDTSAHVGMKGAPVRFVGDMFLTLIQAMGGKVDAFGDPAHAQGPLPIFAA